MPSIACSSDDLHMFPSDSKRASLAQDRARLQRQYRAKEADALAELQEVLRDISRGTTTPQTRVATIAQATKTIKQLYYRNNMLRELYGQSPPVLDHVAEDFNNYLAQVQQPIDWLTFFHSNVPVASRDTDLQNHTGSALWDAESVSFS